jgi:iron complex outermembrane receptor protein
LAALTALRRAARRAQARTAALTIVATIVSAAAGNCAQAQSASPVQGSAAEDLGAMSLEQLTDLPVTSVSKTVEPLRTAAAAIYVITHDDIVRSGATSIPEALRLAPNLVVTQMSASDYVVSARGFGGDPGAQSFSDKLLVLIDGRSVYSPLYSGVYLDAQDVMLEDVDRIEVISGPGATLWGANAMNGVINIITRSADVTDGGLVRAAGGNNEKNGAARYGGKIDDDTSYRIYGMGFQREAMQLPDRSSADDGWSKGQAGFRIDRHTASDSSTVQGDLYRATQNVAQQLDGMIDGANLLGRWKHQFSDQSELQLQAYYDLTERYGPPPGAGAFVLRTYDVELQQSLALGSAHKLIWGAGERINDYDITDTATLLFVPPNRALTLGNVFAQDTVALSSALSATAGIKLEDDPYSGWSALPDARLSWTLNDINQLWAAASRAIRSPTPFDVDVVELLGPGIVGLVGNKGFQPEKVWAYEVGYRAQPAPQVSFSISTFYNVYSDLRTIEPSSSTTFFPLHWGNLMAGDTYGVELWGNYQVSDWWRLSPGYSSIKKRLHFEPGASGVLGVAQAGDDAAGHASLTSSMDLGSNLTFDASARYITALPDPVLRSYYDMNARLGWRACRNLELSLSGSNLLNARHYEFPPPYGEQITRSVMVQAQWSFQ